MIFLEVQSRLLSVSIMLDSKGEEGWNNVESMNGFDFLPLLL